MKLSIIIPVYNEIHTIKIVIDQVLGLDLDGLTREIIVIDDASTDGTREYLKTENRPDITTVFHHNNSGKAACINSARKYLTGDIVIIQDADLEYDPGEYTKLLQPILDGRADVVYGSRFMGSDPHRVLFFWHSIGNKLLTFLSNMLTNLNFTDIETCYKMIRTPIFKAFRITSRGFGVEPEITAKIAKLPCRIYEVGISYWGRNYAEGKKITWKDGFWAIYYIVKYAFWKPDSEMVNKLIIDLGFQSPGPHHHD